MGYDAFISYSHAADGQFAPALQTSLHRFAKPWWKLRSVKVFRDETSLSATHDLTNSIKAALVQARFFILLASPTAAQSKWVGREVGLWLESKAPENILIVLTEGTIVWDQAGDFDWSRTDALPKTMAGAFRAEPLWVDLAWARNSEQLSTRDPRFQQAVARIAAPLHGKSLDEISGEEVRQHRLTKRLVQATVGTVSLLAAGAVTAAWFAREAQLRAERNLQQGLVAVNNVETIVAKDLQDLAGVSTELRMKMLRSAEKVLTELESEGDAPAVLSTRAIMLSEFASAYGALGSYADATLRVKKAIAILADLVKAHPDDVEVRAAYANARKIYGDVLWSQRKDAGIAVAQFQASIDEYAQLISSHPEHPHADDWQLYRFRIFIGIGDVYYAQLDKRVLICADQDDCLSKASRHFAQAMDLAKAMQGRDGDDLHWKNGFLVSQERLAKVYEKHGDLASASRIYEELLKEFQHMSKQQPANSKWQENLIALFWRNAGVQEKTCRLDLALGDYMEALDLARRLHESDPGRLDWTSELAMSLKHAGETHAARQQTKLAREEYEQAAKLTEVLIEKQPSKEELKQSKQEIQTALDHLGDARPPCVAPPSR